MLFYSMLHSALYSLFLFCSMLCFILLCMHILLWSRMYVELEEQKGVT